MTILKTVKRNPEIKAKKLRREGYTTGVLFGKGMKESIPLQFVETDALRLIKANKEGAQVLLDFGSEKISAVVKNIDFDSIKRQILALDFQALVAGEKISTSVPVKLINEDSVKGYINQELTEIHYKAVPADLLEPIEIDCSELTPDVKNIFVKDLAVAQNQDIDFITPADTLVLHIADYMNASVEAEATEESSDEAAAE